MAKYIIEIEDNAMIAASIDQEVDELWKAKGFNSLVFDKNGLDKLIPYTEPDRKTIEDEVWAFAKKVRLEEFIDEEGRLHGYISGFNSYSEAKAKYEAWKKQKDEIRVGDEVEICGTIGIVTRVPYLDEERVHYIAKSGTVYCNNSYAEIKKTGRHFDEVEELLRKVKED